MAYTVKIGGADKTSLVKARTLLMKLDADYRDSCDFTVITTVAGFLPLAGMPVTVEDNSVTVFSGQIQNAPTTKISTIDGSSTKIMVRIEAVAHYQIAYRRYANAAYASVTAGDIVTDLHTDFLAGEGISIGYIGAGADIGEYDARGRAVGSVLDSLASSSGYKWYITHNKELYFQQDGTVVDADNDIDETGLFTDFRNVQKQEELELYRNRQIIKGASFDDGTRIEFVQENAAEITARAAIEGGTGIHENVESDDSVTTLEDAETLADNLLKKYGTVPISIEFQSFTMAWRPGTRLLVYLPSLGIATNRYFLIETVNIRDLGGTLLTATIKASSRDEMNFSTQMRDNYISYFRKLLDSEKKAIARSSEYTNSVRARIEEEILKFNEHLSGALGYYSTIITNPDDSRIAYQHDQPTLAASTYISCVPEPGTFAWTNTGWNAGSPSWNYGYTQDGNAVFRLLSTVGINADWINAGSIDTNVIYVGDETLTTALANMQTQISELASGSGNFIRNSNFGTYENPYDTFWGEGLTWDLLESRNMDWDTLEASITDWNELESGDF